MYFDYRHTRSNVLERFIDASPARRRTGRMGSLYWHELLLGMAVYGALS